MSDTFRVTTRRDGNRSFGRNDDYGQYGSRSRGGRRRNFRRGGGSWNRSESGSRGRGGANPRSRLEDDGDIDMDGGGGHRPPPRRFDPYDSRRRNRGSRGRGAAMDRVNDGASVAGRLGLPLNRNNNRNNRQSHSRSNKNYSDDGLQWFKVKVPHGQKYDKEYILKAITERSDVPFVPHHYQIESTNSVFYVQNQLAADAIRNLSRQITTPKGFELQIYVNPTGPPVIPMDAAALEKLKDAMKKRYDQASKALNLSNLYNDPELTQQGLHMAISRSTIMTQIIKVIVEHIPEMMRLDLSNNKLYSLEHLADMVPKTPNMVELNLSKNQIRSEAELEKISNWKLEVLALDRNPVCDNFKDESVYVSSIRRKFPKVIKLDGHDLPPPILFDVDTTVSLPPPMGSYFMDEQVKNLVLAFVEQYFTIYDSSDRQTLLDAYHQQATLSICSYNSKLGQRNQDLNEYMEVSRNLKRNTGDNIDGRYHDVSSLYMYYVTQWDVMSHASNILGRRKKLLKKGKLDVVALLNSLPKTQHIPPSFTLDVSQKNSMFLTFTVNGLFREEHTKSKPVRAFSRMFITVPQGSGIVILNEHYTITNATMEQIQKVQNPVVASPAPVAGPSQTSPAPLPQMAASPGVTPDIQKEMVIQFSQQSGMNSDWSLKCLVQNEWDYNKAAQVFTQLHGEGKIPAEAFQKMS